MSFHIFFPLRDCYLTNSSEICVTISILGFLSFLTDLASVVHPGLYIMQVVFLMRI